VIGFWLHTTEGNIMFEDDNTFLLCLEDVDGDTISMSQPYKNEDTIMLRIENDGEICGLIVDGPMAMAIMGVLFPVIQKFKLEEYLRTEM
jgi:hypothetical protein